MSAVEGTVGVGVGERLLLLMLLPEDAFSGGRTEKAENPGILSAEDFEVGEGEVFGGGGGGGGVPSSS